MSVEKISAFISATSELEDECEAVCEVCTLLNIEPFFYKRVRANSSPPNSLLLKVIPASEIYIGVLGGKYGSLYPPRNDRSVVEFEFDEARKRPQWHLTAVFPKQLLPEHIEPPQVKFRERAGDIRGGVWTRAFDSIEKLKNEVRDAITLWLMDFYQKYKDQAEPTVVRDHRRVKGVAGVLACCAALLAFLFTILPLATGKTVAIGIGCFAVGIILCMVVVEYLL